MTPAAHACERPTGVVPGIAVVAIAAAWITMPLHAMDDTTSPDAAPADSTGAARTATPTAIDIADAPKPAQNVNAHASATPCSTGRYAHAANDTARSEIAPHSVRSGLPLL